MSAHRNKKAIELPFITFTNIDKYCTARYNKTNLIYIGFYICFEYKIKRESGAVRTSTVFADEKYSLKAAIALLSEKVYFKVEALVGIPAVYMVFAVL